MIDAAEAAQRFVEGRKISDLDNDEMLLFALVRAVEIIGEAAARLSDETKSDIPDIDWPAIVGMRNRLVHAYFDIDHEILWATVSRDLPKLMVQLKSLTLDETP